MRRNLLYRRRNWVATILEVLLPIGFCAIILGLKSLVDDGSDGEAQVVPPQLRTQEDVLVPLSFSDYVTALMAKRVCIQTNKQGVATPTPTSSPTRSNFSLGPQIDNVTDDGISSWGDDDWSNWEQDDDYYAEPRFEISGMPPYGRDWQVPFLKCDERKCQVDGEDAYDYCEYNILAVAAKTAGDAAGKQRAEQFKAYVEERYPQLLDPTRSQYKTHNFVQYFESNDAIDKYVESADYGTPGVEKIGLAVTFDGNDPDDFKYEVRQNATNFNTWDAASQPAAPSTPDTKTLFSTYSTGDYECENLFVFEGSYSYSCTARYIYNGFLTTQRLVQDFMMIETGAKDAGYFVAEHGVRYVPFPVRSYTDSGAFADLSTVMPLLLTLGILYPCATMISYLVQEKELRQKELLKMMGVTDMEIGFSWFLSFWMLHVITATFVTLISQQIFERSNFVLLFIFWQFCFLGFIVLCLLLGTSTSKTTRGVLIGILVVFGGFFLTLASDFQTGSAGIISLLSLHPVTAMVYGVSEIGRLEDEGIGLTPDSMTTTDSPSGYTFAGAIVNIIVSCIYMGVMTWYFNRVIAPDYGQAQPFYFPFTKAYWFPKSTEHEDLKSSDANATDESTPIEPVADNVKQQAVDGQSIEIMNLRKDFGEKVAVDGLNLSIYSGQITALLGHNGAGKTTTISMLTGALSPSGGTATIAGKDIRTEMSSIREDIGICLQHDCLFPKLTVREHVQFFSRVKGIYGKVSREEAEAGIDQAIRDVALGEKSNTFSSNLSGGMKRKLSVAIAFCGGSKVVFLDEPTSGMDPFSRRFSWNVIRQYRQDRCIILTTHFMDEADILGDRIAIMAEGRLRCCGSSLFLKRTYGVGYQLTIEKRSTATSTPEKASKEGKAEAASEDELKDIVMGNVSDAVLLSNVGTELSFQLPLGSSSNFVPMLEQLDVQTKKGSISTYGVSITTLDEVFQIVARGDETTKQEFRSSRFGSKDLVDGTSGEDEEKAKARMDLSNEGLFGTHVGALIRKRAANFKRDRKAWCCTTILPSVFVLIGLLLLKFVSPGRNLEPLELTLDDYNSDVSSDFRNPIPYNDPGSSFTCNPGTCIFSMNSVDLSTTDENYYFCGGPALEDSRQTCTITDSESVFTEIDNYGATLEGGDVGTIAGSSVFILNQSNAYAASQYGGIFMTHDQYSKTQDLFSDSTNKTTEEQVSYAASVEDSCLENADDYLADSECALYGTGIGYTIAYNFTAIHVSPLYQALADEGIVREAIGSNTFRVSATIAPMKITKRESDYAEAIDAFNLWFLIVLSFPFIMGTFATFIVSERESKAKHLQVVAGVKPSAYWLSTLLWDFMNYCIPATITIILVFAFGLDSLTTTENDVLGAFLVLLFLFGPAAAAFSYCVSFCFKSASLCNIVLIISGFLFSMGGSIATFFLRIVSAGDQNMTNKIYRAAVIIEWIFRFFPPFNLGKGLLFIMNIQAWVDINQGGISAFSKDVAGFEILFLAVESVVYLVAAIYIDILSSNPEVMAIFHKLFCCVSSSSRSEVAAIPDDDDVVAEQQRVLSLQAANDAINSREAGDAIESQAAGDAIKDAIVMTELTKIYPNGKIAVNKLSLGIPPGECFGLLGINGAGKTTTMGMLTAEFPPTSGDATLAGFSLRHEPEKTRRRIGYCPQFDAHFQNMTGREHVELYASIKGVASDSVKAAAADKLAQVGLSDSDADRLSSKYSGGMKRRLSLACATIGQPRLVFLDECSTGVDPVARREIWQLVSDLVSAEVPGGEKTSVILTTHSMDECEALCPRIGIMANGKLRCLGSAQHLKTKFGKGYQLELKVDQAVKEDDDYKANLSVLARANGNGEGSVEEVFLHLPQAQSALRQVTNDEYLSSMLNAENPTGYGVFREASSPTGVLLSDLAIFVANELRMRDLNTFVTESYNTAILRERQDMKARFEVSSEGVSIAQIFASIEENKQKLRLSDYGVSQTSLEQVFNMHAAEAERLKQGRMDG